MIKNATVVDQDYTHSNLSPMCDARGLGEMLVGNKTLAQALEKWLKKNKLNEGFFSVRLWPSEALLSQIRTCQTHWIVVDKTTKNIYAKCCVNPPDHADFIFVDADSIIIEYPWDLLRLNEQIINKITKSEIKGSVASGVTIWGHLILGEDSEILPGVMIEGNVIIGKGCRIGPNAYLRGATALGDGVKIGQAVEIKNSIIMHKSAVPHLSYVGDSIIGCHTNIAAGNIISNYRHDGKNHFSEIEGKLIDTQRRKFGAVIGDHVHTGINTTVYPGRKIACHASTLPAEIIQKDKKN